MVWQFGVRYRAVTLLQTAAITYVQHSSIPQKNWHQLFRKNPQFQYVVPATATAQMAERLYSVKMQDLGDDRLMTSETATLAIRRMVQLEAPDATEVGGMFGRDLQFRQLEQSPGIEISPEALDGQLQCWDAARPWSEGLAILFDATQEEVVNQFSSLGNDGRKAQKALLTLSMVEQIAQIYLSPVNRIGSDQPDVHVWLRLTQELDRTATTPASAFTGIAKRVLSNVRQKGLDIVTWTVRYKCTAP